MSDKDTDRIIADLVENPRQQKNVNWDLVDRLFHSRPVPAEVVLDESKFGKRFGGEWNWSFRVKNKRGEYELITVGSSEEPVLVAVTETQYKNWKNREIFAFQRPLVQYYTRKIIRFCNGVYTCVRKLFSISFWKAQIKKRNR